jgi:hypothetical protein
MPELDLPPPRPPGRLLARTLRRHRLRVFAALGVPTLMALAFVAANAYQQSQGLQAWPWGYLWWFVAADVALASLLWLYGRDCFALIRHAYRDGERLPAKVEIVHGDRFVGVKAVFEVAGEPLAMTVPQSGSRLKNGDSCCVLFVSATGETVVVLPDVGIIANVDGQHVATTVETRTGRG